MGDGAEDKAKGNIKEAGGDLTGDDSLKREGKVDKGERQGQGRRRRRVRQGQGRGQPRPQVARLPPAGS